MDSVDNAITKPVSRLEVFTGAGRRRSSSDEDKARIVADIVASAVGNVRGSQKCGSLPYYWHQSH